MVYYVLHMSSIEGRLVAWLSRPTVADQASKLLLLESFKDEQDSDTSTANLGIFAIFSAFHSNSQDLDEGVEGLLILGPVQKPGGQPLEAQNPKDDQTPPE